MSGQQIESCKMYDVISIHRSCFKQFKKSNKFYSSTLKKKQKKFFL